jgi:Flp pilus assembly protein TadB
MEKMELAVNDYAIMDFGYAAVLLLFGVLLVWTARYVWQTKTATSKEKEFRELAERSAVKQVETGARVEGLQADIADLQRRIQAMEKLLKDAE